MASPKGLRKPAPRVSRGPYGPGATTPHEGRARRRHRLSLVWPAIERERERQTGQGHPAINILPQSKVRTTLQHVDSTRLDNPVRSIYRSL
jgi:hypothetical protein